MVDVKMTVRGYMALYVEEKDQANICFRNNPPFGTEAWEEGMRHLENCERYRAKAYELMGVNTIEQPKQLSFFEAL